MTSPSSNPLRRAQRGHGARSKALPPLLYPTQTRISGCERRRVADPTAPWCRRAALREPRTAAAADPQDPYRAVPHSTRRSRTALRCLRNRHRTQRAPSHPPNLPPPPHLTTRRRRTRPSFQARAPHKQPNLQRGYRHSGQASPSAPPSGTTLRQTCSHVLQLDAYRLSTAIIELEVERRLDSDDNTTKCRSVVGSLHDMRYRWPETGLTPTHPAAVRGARR